ILEFEFGTNWSNYSWFVGDIFGAPLAIEGIIAFFMESTFVAVMFFGWNKVSAGFHLASTWLTGLGATISAWWILVANAWMQYPVGCVFNPDTMRNEMVSFFDVALSPFAVDKFCHTITTSWIIGAAFTVGVSAWFLLKRREQKLAVESMKIGSVVGLIASLLAALTGDNSAYMVAQVQPMKLAAMEALYDGGESQGLTAVAWINPFDQPDYASGKEPPMKIVIPNMLSLLATHDANGFVPGINDILKGYTKADGTKELPLKEKILRGQKAIKAMQVYRSGDKSETVKKTISDNMPYFGYGYVTSADQVVPFIPITFWAFRIMVGLGFLFILFFAVAIFFVYKRDITRHRWLLVSAIAIVPLSYIASELGWVVAEMGRQPWTIQDILPTWAAVSDLRPVSVIITFFIFLVLFTTMLCVEVNILCKQIKKGPEHSTIGENVNE
ncbi:MAG TPA: cytochrome ubiquinol oxidase subunit I, partial [Prevotella sp.]